MSLPSFISRLARPFTQPTRLSIAPDSPTPVSTVPEGAELCTVAAGCYWGVEHIYRKHFKGKGLIDAKVGFMGGEERVDSKGNDIEPTYEEVCSGKTGRKSPSSTRTTREAKSADAEAAQITFDPEKVSYRQLIEFFYRTHDPREENKQGYDQGSQYRSVIFFHNEEQERIAREVTSQANDQWWEPKKDGPRGPVTTEIVPAGKWYSALKSHQLYLEKNPWGYQCPTHFFHSEFSPLK